MKKSSKSTARAKVKAANRQENPLAFIRSPDIFNDSAPFVYECRRRFRQLHRSVRKWALDLLATNMKELYERSNWGWNPRAKMVELNAPNAWCLLVKKRSSDSESMEKDHVGGHPNGVDSSASENSSKDDGDRDPEVGEDGVDASDSNDDHGCVAFVHFRYDLDYGIPVLYCYEIQVAPDHQGLGIGRQLLAILRLLAERARMDKVMATVFKNNQGSLEFFKRFGFQEDETNPEENEGKDFIILSLRV